MHLPTFTRTSATCGLALSAMLLHLAPAHAAPVFSFSDLGVDTNYNSTGPAPCTTVANPEADASQALVENAPPVTKQASVTGTLTEDAEPADVLTFATSVEATGRLTAASGNPRTISLEGTGDYSVSTSMPTSSCEVSLESEASLDYEFTVTKAGWLTFDVRGATPDTEININLDREMQEILELEDFRGRAEAQLSHFLTPGVYSGNIDGGIATPNAGISSAATGSAAFSVVGTFALAGSRSDGPTGKAKKYLAFPKSRNCATDKVEMKVKGAGAAAIKSVSFLVNGKSVKKVAGPKAGKIKLPAAETLAADVLAKVTLKPTRRGAKPTVVEGSASYLACG